ncbi:divalent metal cation transporter [Sporolactobacillus sp. THM19-2]|nr:divalent metal cation transporter [Sporolactobacillus sp. THM19-2]
MGEEEDDRVSYREDERSILQAVDGAQAQAVPRTRGRKDHSKTFQSVIASRQGWKQVLPFLGPAFIAAVAYIDPGNYATNIQSGSQYGYMLLWVCVASNLMAILIQTMSAKLGIATGKNLPEVSREHYPAWASVLFWIQGEVMVMATDLAEFIGATLGFNLVFGIPMIPAAILTAICALAILLFQVKGYRPLEAVIAMMVFVVVGAFTCEMLMAFPPLAPVFKGMVVPQFQGTDSIMLAAGILGATVMPHAIYLHSGLTNRRVIGQSPEEKKRIFHFELVDILIAMILAGFINATMLIVSASTFHTRGIVIDDLTVAFNKFGDLLGPSAALLFGIGLLSAGLSSSSVGTLAGDIIMQGYIRKKIPIFIRRICSMVPPLAIVISGANATYALVMSQVVLSFGIALALIPLIIFTARKDIMGNLVNRKLTSSVAWVIAGIIICLNIFLLYQTFFG